MCSTNAAHHDQTSTARLHTPFFRALLCLLFSLSTVLALSGTTQADESEEPAIGAAERTAILDTVVSLIERYYIDTNNITAVVDYIKARQSSGQYDNLNLLSSYRTSLTDDLRQVSGDSHFGVWPLSTSMTMYEESEDDRLREAERARYGNYGFERLERFPGNVGYLELVEFVHPRMAGPTAAAAMDFLANCDAIVIDLRRNTGGWGEMVALLCSYLFADQTLLSTTYDRHLNRTSQTWTDVWVSGPRLDSIPVWVLQSRGTFSAAEDLSYTLQSLGRATVVGETSRGGGHPVYDFNVESQGICISIPIAASVNPVTGTSFQGTGVKPDFAVTSEKALAKACTLAVEELLKKTTDEARQRTLRRALERYEAELNPIELSAKAENELLGEYRYSKSYSFKVVLRGDQLVLVSALGNTYSLIPCGHDRFAARESELSVDFLRNDRGKVNALRTAHADGETVYRRVE